MGNSARPIVTGDVARDARQCNRHLRDRGKRFTYWTPKQLAKRLKGCRRRPHSRSKDGMGYWEGADVFFKGKWRRLCRTDMLDDVRTTGRGIRIKGSLGARVTPTSIYIIDALTDG